MKGEEKKMLQHLRDRFREINKIAEKDGVVLLGSNYFTDFPVNELAHKYDLKTPIYNRSVPNSTISEISDMLEQCVFELDPAKVFVAVGDYDIKKPDFSPDEFLNQYEYLLYQIHSKINTEIYIVSVFSDSPIAAAVNKRLRGLAKENGCKFINITSAINFDNRELRVFEALRFYFRVKPICFSDAMKFAPVN